MADLNLPAQLQTRDADRKRRYAEYLKLYDGVHYEGVTRRSQRRLTFNYLRALVDKTTSYLMTGRDVAVDAPRPPGGPGGTIASDVEAALRHVWDANFLDTLDYDTEVDAAVLGDGAYRVSWDAEAGQVRVTSPDVQGLHAWWRAEDPVSPRRVALSWTGTVHDVAPALGFVPAITNADKVQVIEDWTDETYTLWLDRAVFIDGPNPYGVVPFVVFANARQPKSPWGLSDLEQVKESQHEFNRATTQLSRILELSGNPITVLENVTGSEDIAVEPGVIWELPEGAKAGVLDLLKSGVVERHSDYVGLLLRTLADLSETPRAAFGENPRGLSGVALAIELDPLLKKVQRKRLIRSVAYRRRNDLIIALINRMTGSALPTGTTRMVWGAITPDDRTQQVDDEVKLINAGVHSRRRAADQLGVEDPDAEFVQWQQEQRAIGGQASDQRSIGFSHSIEAE